MGILTVSPDKAHTLSEFIEAGREIAISYDNMSFIEKMGNINFPVYNVLQDYVDDFRPHASTVILNDKEYFKYKYKPRLLCQDLYGNTELYFVLLMLNGIADVKEFDSEKFLIFGKQDMQDLISCIYNAEQDQIERYANLTENNTES